MHALVKGDGDVELPQSVRDGMGLEPGDAVDLDLKGDGSLVVRKAEAAPREPPDPDRFRKAAGTLDLGMTTNEFMEMMRGPAE